MKLIDWKATCERDSAVGFGIQSSDAALGVGISSHRNFN